MRVIKKVLYIIPLLITLIFVYVTVTGKLQQKLEGLKGTMDEQKKENIQEDIKEGKEDENSENETVEIPEGKIVLKDYFKEWEIEPMVEVYDPDSKIAKNDVYGTTKDEMEHKEALYDAQEKLRAEFKIPSEYIGQEFFNKDKIINWGDVFETEFFKCTYVCDNLVIRDDFKGLNEKYYMDGKDILLSKLDANGHLNNISMWSAEGEEIVNPECKLVMFDVTITPHSDWVTEPEAVPQLRFLNDRENVLVDMLMEDNEGYYNESGELDITGSSQMPIYYDLGLYDIDTIGSNDIPYLCPMRKGEVISFTVGYIVPVELFDKAYFVYNPDKYTATNYSYATKDIAIWKLSK